MKITTKTSKPKFTSVEFNIKIDSLDELKVLWTLFNRRVPDVEKDAEESGIQYKFTYPRNMINVLWNEVEKTLNQYINDNDN